MSKKIAKRSLALGALMAFAITGSAMASNLIVEGKYAWVYDAETQVPSGDYSGWYSPIAAYADAEFGDITSSISYNTDQVPTLQGISVRKGATATFNGTTRISVTNTCDSANAGARAVDLGSADASSAIFKGDTYLKADGYNALGVFASGANPQNITFEKALTVDVNGKGEVAGILVQNGGVVSVAGNAKIKATNNDGVAMGIYNLHYNQVTGSDGGTISLLGDIEIIAKGSNAENGYAIYNGEGAETTTVGSATSKVILEGNIKADDGTVTTTLGTADSYLTGAVTTATSAKTTINMVEGATWNVTGNSVVAEVGGSKGTIVLEEVAADTLAEVEIGENSNADLTICGNAAMTQDIEKASDVDAAANIALQYLAEAVDVQAGNAVTFATAEGEIVGSYSATAEEGQIVGTIKEAVNSKNQAIGEAAVALKAHFRAHMNDMNKRMGELRYSNGEHGVWTRMVRGENEYEGAKAQYNQYQVGYDEKVGDWSVGAALTYSEGNSNYATGKTEDESKAFALYGSKLNDDGSFVDVIARYAKLDTEMEDLTGNGDYDTDGYSVSVEYGKRYAQTNGLWIEPQVELTYGTVDSADFKLGNKDVTVGDMDSFIGRVGFSIGKDIEEGNLYARASYLYDFDGETETSFAANGISRTIAEDLGGGWWEVGVGANIHLSDATYLYADVERTMGGEVETNWKWNLGFRYSF